MINETKRILCVKNIRNQAMIEVFLKFKEGKTINPYPTEFLKWNNPLSNFGTVHYHFQGYEVDNLKMVSQLYRAWSDCTDEQAGLTLYLWERLITFSFYRIRVRSYFLVAYFNILHQENPWYLFSISK